MVLMVNSSGICFHFNMILQLVNSYIFQIFSLEIFYKVLGMGWAELRLPNI